MDIAPLSSIGAAEAARAMGPAHNQRRSPAAGFGAALDAALTKPAATRRESGVRDAERNRTREREDEEDRIAAAQQSAWQAAREARAAQRPQPRTAAERVERVAEDVRAHGSIGRSEGAHGDAPPPPAAAAAVAMARRIEAARENAGETKAADAATSAADAAAPATGSASTGEANAAADADRTVHDVERSLDALAPAFRGRLERVIARMEAEGHDVTVTETQRDPERQDHLYAQGRTRPGPVVTWTRNSNHMRGMAADLVVDGSYDNPAGYARLASIAAEEGLQTLGARDAGHVEMRGAAPLVRTPAGTAAAAQKIQPELIGPLYVQGGTLGVAQVAAVAEVAGVAPVAGVAQVAQVAAVAQVAQPGSYAPVAQPGPSSQVAQPLPAEGARVSSNESAAAQVAAHAVASVDGKAAKDGDANGEGTTGSQPQPHVAAAPESTAPAAPFAFDVARTATVRTEGADAVQRADVAGRLERVQALQDAASAQPLSQVTLRVEGEDGSTARINVGLRGNTVGATIDAADPLAAASMRAHVAELRQALERQGLEPSTLLVRTAARLDGGDAGKLAAALTSADALAALATSASRESTQREHGNGQNQQHTATRRDPDAQRQRQNQKSKEERP